MAKSLSILVLSLFTLLSSAQEIDFIDNDFEKAMKMAKKQNKIIFVDAYATWCGPCKKMSREVFPNDEVAEFYNKNFINLKIDVEKSEGIEFQKDYPVEAMPTLYYINPDGTIAKKFVGYKDAEDFLQLGKDVLDPENSKSYIYAKKYEKGNRDKDFLYDYIIVLYDEGEDATEVINEYFKDMPVEQLDSLKTFAVFLAYEVGVSSEYSIYFAQNYDRFVGDYGEYAEDKFIEIIMVDLNYAIENSKKAHLDKIYDYIAYAIEDEETLESLKSDIEDAYEEGL